MQNMKNKKENFLKKNYQKQQNKGTNRPEN